MNVQKITQQEPADFQVDESPVGLEKWKIALLVLSVCGVFILIFWVMIWLVGLREVEVGTESQVGARGDQIAQVLTTPTPSPFPFQEMTIPNLRNREYFSELSELERFSSNGPYISYLTSYDSDGLQVNGLLTVPTGEVPADGWPAVVFVHGYIPPDEYVTTQNYADYVDYLARNDLVVFKIDLRGHGESEGVPGGAYYSEDYIVDVLNARAALFTSDAVPVSDVGLWGHSMAGNVVFRSLIAAEDIPAVVIWAGAVYSYSDMEKFRIQDSSYQPPAENSPRRQERRRLRELYGEFDADSDFWKQVVPINYLDGVSGAVQVHHATDDPVVNVGYSRDLMGYLEDTAIEGELYEYASGGHNITGSAFTQAMEQSMVFFREKLQ